VEVLFLYGGYFGVLFGGYGEEGRLATENAQVGAELVGVAVEEDRLKRVDQLKLVKDDL